MRFAFRTAGQVVFGPGEGRAGPDVAASFGRRVLLVTGSASLERSGRLEEVLDRLAGAGAEAIRYPVAGEPELATIDLGAELCREAGCECVLAVGGGAVVDTGKAVAAVATSGGATLDYLEEVGAGRELTRPPLPVVAVPTTAGTGSEATRNSVIRVPGLAVKRSLRNDLLLPRVAIIDPELSATAPVAVAAAAGLDALTHLVEAYVSTGANPMTDAVIRPGIRLSIQGLNALAHGGDPESAAKRALAALWGGIALANAGLGAVHGLAAPLGGRCRVGHGVACACLLPHTVRANVQALRGRAPENPALGRYEEVSTIVTGEDPDPERAASALEDLRVRLGVPSLASLGVTADDLAPVVQGSRGGSMRSNPVELTDAELEGILAGALGAAGAA